MGEVAAFLFGVGAGAALMGAHWCWHFAKVLRRLREAGQWRALKIICPDLGASNDG